MAEFTSTLIFLTGSLLGGAVVYFVFSGRQKEAARLKDELKGAFSAISMEALQKNADQFVRLAHEVLNQKTSLASQDLEGKKALIDKTLEGIEVRIREVQQTIHQSDKNQNTNLSLLIKQLELSKQATESLKETAGKLHAALANTKKRGEWGERMAEDVLRLAGFQEGINYAKQKSLLASDESLSRPDFTFFLPQNLKLNMDVKFPFDNYLRYLECENETDRETYKQQFLRDVRNRIKEVTSRDYINQETVDYCLVFIPNEQVYGFIHAEDPELLDTALKSRVVLSSPLTLYAVLALIRQAVDNFNLGKTNREILSNLSLFRKQWENFLLALEKVGKRIADTQKEYDALLTTRKSALERPLKKIEELKQDSKELGSAAQGEPKPEPEEEEEVSLVEEKN
jgi:DNA recombination protein RmuC